MQLLACQHYIGCKDPDPQACIWSACIVKAGRKSSNQKFLMTLKEPPHRGSIPELLLLIFSVGGENGFQLDDAELPVVRLGWRRHIVESLQYPTY